MLSVVAIIAVVTASIGPAVNAISSGNRVSSSASEIAGLLEQARSYAMANNTWVFVALTEVDAANPAGAEQQEPGIGRVIVAVLGSRNGTRNFAPSNLTGLTRIRSFEDIHLEDAIPRSGNLARPDIAAEMRAANPVFQAESPLSWANGGSGAAFTFTKVIQFDPSGTAGLQSSNHSVAPRIEIGLTPSRENTVIESTNQAALVLDGVTGSVKVYRP